MIIWFIVLFITILLAITFLICIGRALSRIDSNDNYKNLLEDLIGYFSLYGTIGGITFLIVYPIIQIFN